MNSGRGINPVGPTVYTPSTATGLPWFQHENLGFLPEAVRVMKPPLAFESVAYSRDRAAEVVLGTLHTGGDIGEISIAIQPARMEVSVDLPVGEDSRQVGDTSVRNSSSLSSPG